MKKIDKHNYEAFLLDSIEGRLTAEQQLELDLFMALNPDLAIDFEDLSVMTFDPQQTFFDGKAGLKKTESDLVPAEHFIAYIEQQLSAEEKRLLEKSCDTNPSLAKELALYQSTIAVADTGIVFENKESLKRRPKVILFNFRAASFAAAASVAFLIMLYVMWPVKTANVMTNTYAHAGERKAGVKELFNNNAEANPGTAQNAATSPNANQNNLANHSSKKDRMIAQQATNYTGTNTPVANTSDTSNRNIASVKGYESLPKKEPVLVASATPKTVVEVITENDEEADKAVKKKQGFWALAGKTLRGLNKAGLKTVDGKEETNKENASYALTLGGMSITHKAH